MNSAVVELLARNLARLRDEHLLGLSSVVSQSLAAIDFSQRSSIGKSFEIFQSASVSTQRAYGVNVCAEVLKIVEQTQKTLTANDKLKILSVVDKYFHHAMYEDRWEGFEKVVLRHYERRSMKVDFTPYRLDLNRALYIADSVNFVRLSRAKLADDLELIVQRSGVHESEGVGMKVRSEESKLEQANRLIKLEPNVFGIGLNLNYLLRRLLGRKE